MDELNPDISSLRKNTEEIVKSGLDDIYQSKISRTLSCNEEDECNKFQLYILNQSKIIKRSITKIIIFLLIFTIVEFFGSLYSNSVGVLTISAELLNHLIKSIITIISILIIEKPANEIMTYGYHRSEIIASLCSTLIVLVISIWIVHDSIETLMIPRQINSIEMIIFSILGLIFNLIIRHIKEIYPAPDLDEGKYFKNYETTRNLELKSRLLEDYLGIEDKENNVIEKISEKQIINLQQKEKMHLLCDIAQSSFTIIASLLIYFFQVRFPLVRLFDDICGINFMIIMLIISIPIIKECVMILMEGAPKDIQVKNLLNDLMEVNGVLNVHDIHLWSLSIGRPCISMHILSDIPQKSLEGATKVCKKYGITHCTIQVEDSSTGKKLSRLDCNNAIKNSIH